MRADGKQPRRRHAAVALAMVMVMAAMLSCGEGGGGQDDAQDGGEAVRRGEGTTTTPTTEVPTTTGPPTTAPPTTIPVGPVGETVSNGSWALVVHGVTDPYGPASTPSGDRAVLVDLEVTHIGQGGTTSITAYDNFQLTAGDLSSPGVDVQGMPSITGTLTGGQALRGAMAFLVDMEMTAGMQLVFRPGLVDDPVVAVQIS